MKIAFLSDTHYGNMANPSHEGGDRSFYEDDHVELATRAHAAKPEVLVVAGDVAETNGYANLDLLAEFFETYKNPHGASLFITGNHDVWCTSCKMDAEEKYDWHFEQAEKHGWIGLRDEPWSKDGVYIAGSMGWYDFSSAPPELGMTPERFEMERRWSDYQAMGYPSFLARKGEMPMSRLCERRVAELERSLSKVPDDRKKLVVVTHMVGFRELLGPIWDYYTAFFGNFPMGKRILKAKPDLYYCGHTHSRAEAEIHGVRCVNNGSGYGHGTKRLDIIDL